MVGAEDSIRVLLWQEQIRYHDGMETIVDQAQAKPAQKKYSGPNRKVTYRLYPSAMQEERLNELLGLHCRIYNAALADRIEFYQAHKEDRKKSLTYVDQCALARDWRKEHESLSTVYSASIQVTLDRLDKAYKAFFRRVQAGETPGFPRFKSIRRYPGWGYKQHGFGYQLESATGQHGAIILHSIGKIRIRGKARIHGEPSSCEILHKQGKWYASVTMRVTPEQLKENRACGTKVGAFDWGVKTFLTIADEQGIHAVQNPRYLQRQLGELARLQRIAARKQEAARQSFPQWKKGLPKSKSLQRIYSQIGRLHGKIARKRDNFLHQTSAGLVKEYAILATEKLNVQKLVRKNQQPAGGSKRRKGLRREILATSPAKFIRLTQYKAEEAGTWFEECETKQIKPTQRCHSCWNLPKDKKLLSDRVHSCPDCGETCGRDENAARVILRWVQEKIQSVPDWLDSDPFGREPSDEWSGGSFTARKLETSAIV